MWSIRGSVAYTTIFILVVVLIGLEFLSLSRKVHISDLTHPPDSDAATFGVNVYGWLGGDFGGGRTVRYINISC